MRGSIGQNAVDGNRHDDNGRATDMSVFILNLCKTNIVVVALEVEVEAEVGMPGAVIVAAVDVPLWCSVIGILLLSAALFQPRARRSIFYCTYHTRSRTRSRRRRKRRRFSDPSLAFDHIEDVSSTFNLQPPSNTHDECPQSQEHF